MIRAIGVHGQTIRHSPRDGYTYQLNAPALLAELTGINVIADFRSRDIAAKGQGAPLVPAAHQAWFRADYPRAVVNIGGFSNITVLPAKDDDESSVIGFDCGPGNVLMDAWIGRHQGQAFDKDGVWASSGKVIPNLLEAFSRDDYFHQKPPKSTGREQFDLGWVLRHLVGRNDRPQDVQATLLALTVHAIAIAVEQFAPKAKEIVLCGGGALNSALVNALRARLSCDVRIVDELGIQAMDVEALAFAWLAHAHMEGVFGNCPSVTGAHGGRILGALYPA